MPPPGGGPRERANGGRAAVGRRARGGGRRRGCGRARAARAAASVFLWDEQNLLQERDQAGALVAHYTDFPGEWGGLTSQRRGGASGYFGFDSQASTRILVSEAGVVTDRYAFTGFGEEIASSGSTPNPYRYGGAFGYRRQQAGWSYVRARVLESASGRWISRDPIGFEGGDWNLYRYVGNQPVTQFDPMGYQAERVPGPPVPLPPWLRPALPIESPGQPGFWKWIFGCGSRLVGAGAAIGFLCAQKAAGPIPRKNQTCKDLYPTIAPLGSVYQEELRAGQAHTGRNCNDAMASALARVRKRYPRVGLKTKTDPAYDGPCNGQGGKPTGGEHTVVKIPGGDSRKGATIVCCPTCRDLPEINLAELGCTCKILSPSRGPWRD